MEPHWERGYRCHGYWLDGKRVGYVGLSPFCHGAGSVKSDGYSWGLDSEDLQRPPKRRTVFSLRMAKRLVEQAYREKTACGLTPGVAAEGDARRIVAQDRTPGE